MNCGKCKLNKIGPYTAPFGGYMCIKDHLQCFECDMKGHGQCGVCGSYTRYVEMRIILPPYQTESMKRSIENPTEQSSNNASEVNEIKATDDKNRKGKKDEEAKIALNSKDYQIEKINQRSINAFDVKQQKEEKSQKSCNKTTELQYHIDNSRIPKLMRQSPINIKSQDSKTTKIPDRHHKRLSLSVQNSITTKKRTVTKAIDGHRNQLSHSADNTAQLCYHHFVSQGTQLNDKTVVLENDLDDAGAMGGSKTRFRDSADSLNNFYPRDTNDAHKKSICVSTESEPSLKIHSEPVALQMEVDLPSAFKTHNFLVLRTMGIPKPDSDVMVQKDKMERRTLDLRMQKILETFQENPRIRFKDDTTVDIEHSKANLIKMNSPGLTVDAAIEPKIKSIIKVATKSKVESNESPKYELIDSAAQTDLTIKSSLSTLHLLNVSRAYYNPPPSLPMSANLRILASVSKPIAQKPPPAQFQVVSCSSNTIRNLLIAKGHIVSVKPVPACTINIIRTPIQCPETSCQRMIFVSDFNKHLVIDHDHLLVGRIKPFQTKSFFIDPRLAHCDLTKCSLLYLLCDKVTDLGSSRYKDFLPVIVMTSRINAAQMCSFTETADQDLYRNCVSKEFVIIWITGIVPEPLSISVSLAVWAHNGQVPNCHQSYSGELYSIRKSQKAIDVWKSGHMLLLSDSELNLLTKGGREMLSLQLSVH